MTLSISSIREEIFRRLLLSISLNLSKNYLILGFFSFKLTKKSSIYLKIAAIFSYPASKYNKSIYKFLAYIQTKF